MLLPTCSWEVPALALSELSLAGSGISMGAGQEQPGLGQGLRPQGRERPRGSVPEPPQSFWPSNRAPKLLKQLCVQGLSRGVGLLMLMVEP